jgi:pilus assembly protein CpaD
MLPRTVIGSSLAGLLALLLAGACTPPEIEIAQANMVNSGIVEADTADIPLAFDPATGRLRLTERATAAAALRAFGPSDTIHARIVGVAGAHARADVRRLLDDAGVPSANIRFDDITAAPAGLRVQRFTVTPPECPGWADIQDNYAANGPLLPLGCITRRNLQLMVEDPRDLVIGRTLDPADGRREADAITRYQSGKVKEFPSKTATGGSGSAITLK